MAPTWAFASLLTPEQTAREPARVVVGRLHRAVGELRRVRRRDPGRARAGAVLCVEMVPAAVEPVEDPLASLAAEVVRTIDALAPLLDEDEGRDERLERLAALLAADGQGRIARLGEHWGALCGAPARARTWALRLRPALDELAAPPGLATACLSSHVAAGMTEETLALLAARPLALWPERQFGVRALAARGEVDAALAYAAASNPLGHAFAREIARVCEEVMLAAGRRGEAYRRFAFAAWTQQNCLQSFKALARGYPEVPPAELLSDLIEREPGGEGRWFATACSLRFFELALEIAARSPCDPRTLCRQGSARLDGDPAFARAAGLAALRWIAAGHGVEISGEDLFAAHDLVRDAAGRLGESARSAAQIRAVLDQPTAAAAWAQQLLGPDLDAW